MPSVLVIVASYLVGSIPFSFLVARAFGVEDVRRVGSGNVGATNVLRSAGRRAGGLALLLDAAKGVVASLTAVTLAPDQELIWALAAVAAVVGHMYPVWLRFQGGKGVATGFGAFAPLAPVAALGATVLFLLTLGATRFVSLSSIVGAVSLFSFALVLGGPGPVVWASAFTAGLVVLRHRSNVHRLWTGEERRAGEPRR
jgi:glycerol-3-phosphate acyltransferase PlsY